MYIFQPGMACTIEKVLADARMLVDRLREHDGSAESLIAQTQTLNKRVEAMKQYQEDLNELNEIARHRPRSSLIMNLAQENTQIRELQAENRDLRLALEEHQNALELIMSKYREQIVKLMLANKLDRSTTEADQNAEDKVKEIEEKMDKICEMAAVMQHAISIDEEAGTHDEQLIQQLQVENSTLRDLLHISQANTLRLSQTEESATQTLSEETETSDEGDTSSELNVTVIEAIPKQEPAKDKKSAKK